jgi:hypothetical protein
MNILIKNSTYFVDIDGTVIKYRPFELLLLLDPEPIQDVINKINKEYDKGSHIVITTARPEMLKAHTKKELNKIGLKYHQLVMGIGRGTRYLINDTDPEKPKAKRAVGVNLIRNKGLKGKS